MNSEIITYTDPKSPISEIFKTLRTNLQFMNHNNETMTLLVTSTMPGEGKSWITTNLAVAFAQSNKKVVIIDSDMRKGRIHNIFGTKLIPGFSNYLSDDKKKSIKDYLIKTEIDNLWIVSAGNVPPNPSELLSNEKMVIGLQELKSCFDIIIFDSTPCMLVTDAVIISRMVDKTIIVTSHKKTKMENLKQVQRSIENVGGKIAGIVINRIPISLKQYKGKYYYYGKENDQKLLEEGKNIEDNDVEVPKMEEETKDKDKVTVAKQNNSQLKKVEKKTRDNNTTTKQSSNAKVQKNEEHQIDHNDDIMNQIDEYLNNINKT